MLTLAGLVALLFLPEPDAHGAAPYLAARSHGVRAIAPSMASAPPSARRLVAGCEVPACAAATQTPWHGSFEVGGELEASDDGARPGGAGRCQDASRVTGLTLCGLTVSSAGLTLFVLDRRTGRVHPVRATLSRRGFRVTVRF